MSGMIKRQNDIESETESNIVDDDFDFEQNDLMKKIAAMEEDEPSVFWSMKLVAGEEQFIEEPSIVGYHIRITHASFGPKINKNTRTVVMIEFEDNDEPVPICVLNSNQESIALDLIINELAMLQIDGSEASEVYLTGYLEPAFNDQEDMESVGLPQSYFDAENEDENEDDDIQVIDDEAFEDNS
eukprot:42100_1